MLLSKSKFIVANLNFWLFQEFRISYDWTFITPIVFNPPIKTRFVKIKLHSWSKEKFLQFESYGCVVENATTIHPLGKFTVGLRRFELG